MYIRVLQTPDADCFRLQRGGQSQCQLMPEDLAWPLSFTARVGGSETLQICEVARNAFL